MRDITDNKSIAAIAALLALALVAPAQAQSDRFALFQLNTKSTDLKQAIRRMQSLSEQMSHATSNSEGCSLARQLAQSQREVQVLAESVASYASQLGADDAGRAAVDLHNSVLEDRKRLEAELLPQCAAMGY